MGKENLRSSKDGLINPFFNELGWFIPTVTPSSAALHTTLFIRVYRVCYCIHAPYKPRILWPILFSARPYSPLDFTQGLSNDDNELYFSWNVFIGWYSKQSVLVILLK